MEYASGKSNKVRLKAENLSVPDHIRVAMEEQAKIQAAQPHLVENYLGFKLVQCGGRPYAVAGGVGRVDLATMAAGDLAKLPNADTPEAVKEMVVNSRDKITGAADELKAAIREALVSALRDEMAQRPATAPAATAETASTPQLIEGFLDYNLIAYSGQYYGALKSLGAVDLEDSRSRESFASRAENALIVADTIGELTERIVRLAISAKLLGADTALKEARTNLQRAERDIAARDEKLTALGARTTQLAHDLSSRDQQIAALERRLGDLANELSNRDQSIAAFHAREARLSNDISGRDQQIAALKTREAQLSNDMSARDQQIAALKAREAQLSNDMSARDQQIAALKAREAQLSNDVSARDQQIAALKAREAQLSDDVSARDQKIKADTARVTALQSEAAALASKNALLERRLEATFAEVVTADAAREKLAQDLTGVREDLAPHSIARRR